MNRYPTTRHTPSSLNIAAEKLVAFIAKEHSQTLFILEYTPEAGHHVRSEQVIDPYNAEQVLSMMTPPLEAGKSVGAPSRTDNLAGVSKQGKAYIYWEAE